MMMCLQIFLLCVELLLLFGKEALAHGRPPLTKDPIELCEAPPVVNHGNLLICIECLLAEVIAVAEDVPRNNELRIAETSVELLVLLCHQARYVGARALMCRSRLEISLEPVRGEVTILGDHSGLICAIDIADLCLNIYL